MLLKILIDAEKQWPQDESIKAAKITLLSRTKLQEAEEAATAKETEKKYAELVAAAKPVLDFMFKVDQETGSYALKFLPSYLDELRRTSQLNLKLEEHAITDRSLSALHDLGYLSYEVGSYEQASDFLHVCTHIPHRSDPKKQISALWGKLACDTLSEFWDRALEDIVALREHLKHDKGEKPTPTIQKVWLLHWSLIFYFKGVKATSVFIDHAIDFETYTYQNVIECAAPHLLRYLCVAAVLHRNRRSANRYIQKMVGRAHYCSTDPIMKFMDALGNKKDFEKARELLAECDRVLQTDFFLRDSRQDFLSNAQRMMYEDYLRVHKTVDINSLARQLNKSPAEAEVWLVDLLREAKIEGQIDSTKQIAHIMHSCGFRRDIYKLVMDRLERPAASAS